MATWKIEQAELIEWLRAYDGPRFHSIVCDPPYALISIGKRFGKQGSAPAQEGTDGRYSRLSKGFMGQKWDGFDTLDQYREWVASWAKLLIDKALEPGAVCMFFGGTRTWHHLALGLEQGGFEVYDTIMWLHGSGFPKGLRQTPHIWDNVLQCQLSASAPLVVQTSRPIRLKLSSDTEPIVLALARILPAGDPVLLMETGKADGSFEVMATLLSLLEEQQVATDLNMISLWKESLGVRYDAVSTYITETESNLKMVQKILNSCQLVSTQKNILRNVTLADGQLWYACDVVERLNDGSTKSNVIPILTVLGSVTSNPIRSWSGHNVSLKPAWEPIILCRTPRGDLTYAQLAMKHQSGALNIDGARITGVSYASPHTKPGFTHNKGWNENSMKALEPKIGVGRWPANLILSHHEDCVRMGEMLVENPSGDVTGDEPSEVTKDVYGKFKGRKPFSSYSVKGRVINRWKDGMKPFGEGAGGEYETIHPSREGEASADRTYESEGGTDFAMKPGERREPNIELVERYACVPECPVRQLDDSIREGLGRSSMGGGTVRIDESDHESNTVRMTNRLAGDRTPQYYDVGGPSRFFYTSKAARAEKDLGLDDFYWKRVDTGFERVMEAEWKKLNKRERARGCIHPTIKPTAIIRYLATLVIPPKQDGIIRRMLIPFSGSGSEIIGAIQAGWDEVTGVEMEPNYNEMAHARLRAAIGMF